MGGVCSGTKEGWLDRVEGSQLEPAQSYTQTQPGSPPELAMTLQSC